ncbi:extracellular metalloproteinase MEP [Ceratobasidium sp. AG-Ba]|nr:extracellular metalloproteinase MEP [Ceratobasidium sp. AG-Ba]
MPSSRTKRDGEITPSLDAAKSFLQSKLGLQPDSLRHISGHTSDIASHEYFSQVFNGIPVANAVANVALVNGAVVSFGSSFVKPTNIASAQPAMSPSEAISAAQLALGGEYNGWPTSLEYFAKDDGSLVLTHVVQIENIQTADWYEAFVDASTGEIVNVNDFVADASYLAVPSKFQDIRGGYAVQNDPADKSASPNKWHTYNGRTRSRTDGNNALAYYGASTDNSVEQSSRLNNYNYRFNPSTSPGTLVNKKASAVNAFYMVNMLHDYTYKYGFTEDARNFQLANNNKGGLGNDRVNISVQDPSGFNNARFATPPDGQNGKMTMLIWNYTTPNRDSAMSNDVIAHEYGHGVSNRLTGGGTGRCLQELEPRSLGEGWSDTLARLTETNSARDIDFTLGSYLMGNTLGIRKYPYSTNMKTNPLTYSAFSPNKTRHDNGAIWASIWHEIITSLLQQDGYSATKNNANSKGGNIVAMHLFIDGMKLQPCSPTFLDARNGNSRTIEMTNAY